MKKTTTTTTTTKTKQNNNNNKLKVQSIFTTQNNITCKKIWKQRTVTTLYTPEI
jgi:hypothetical protein